MQKLIMTFPCHIAIDQLFSLMRLYVSWAVLLTELGSEEAIHAFVISCPSVVLLYWSWVSSLTGLGLQLEKIGLIWFYLMNLLGQDSQAKPQDGNRRGRENGIMQGLITLSLRTGTASFPYNLLCKTSY